MTRRTRGTTLVELLIFGGLGVVVLGLCFFLFVGGTERTVKVTRAQQDLLSLEASYEMLLRDLRQAVPARPQDPELAVTLRTLEEAEELSFMIATREGPPRRVRWSFDSGTGQISRDGEPVKSSRFEKVTFTHRSRQGIPYLVVRFVLPEGTPDSARERVLTRVLSPPLEDPRFGWSARLPAKT